MQIEVCFICYKEQCVQVNCFLYYLIVEGKMVCILCYDVYGDNLKFLIKSSINDICYICYMEKCGLFVYNYQLVIEDCGICYNLYGMIIVNLFKVCLFFLCQECYSYDSYLGQVVGLLMVCSIGLIVLGMVVCGCLNCYINIYGGNSM